MTTRLRLDGLFICHNMTFTFLRYALIILFEKTNWNFKRNHHPLKKLMKSMWYLDDNGLLLSFNPPRWWNLIRKWAGRFVKKNSAALVLSMKTSITIKSSRCCLFLGFFHGKFTLLSDNADENQRLEQLEKNTFSFHRK